MYHTFLLFSMGKLKYAVHLTGIYPCLYYIPNFWNVNTKILEIYPNPISDNFNIKTNENLKSIEVYDINGRKIQDLSVNLGSNSYSLKNLKNSVYILRIKADDDKTYIKKVIKK